MAPPREEPQERESTTGTKEDLPPTNMLYMTYEGNWQMSCPATILAVTTTAVVPPSEGKNSETCTVELVLDQTVLHAQGGGQPTDQGQILFKDKDDESNVLVVVNITKVTLDRATGIATHTGTISTDENNHGMEWLQVGATVTVCVNPELRRILSECHTAGHVVDSAMAVCGKLFRPTKGYHFLDGPYVEYQGSIPATEQASFLHDLQQAFCQLIDKDIPTKIESSMSVDEANAVCNRMAHNFDVNVFADARTATVRVVTVAGFPCPCGGTHVRSTADLKARQWAVTGLKSKKNVLRVKYGPQQEQQTKPTAP